MDLPSPGLMVLADLLTAGSRAMRFLISAAIVINACSTLDAFLALVSMKGMPISSANALAVLKSTTRLLVKSVYEQASKCRGTAVRRETFED